VSGESYAQKSAAAKHDLEKQVTDQYLSTLQYLLLHNLSGTIVRNLHDQLGITGDLVAKGYATASDYLQLQIEAKTQSIMMDQTWQNYRSGLSQLYALCGIRDTATVMLDTVALQSTEIGPASRFLLPFRLDSIGAEAQQHVFEARYQPQVSLFMNAGLNAVELVDVQRRFGMSAGINLSLPILDGGQRSIAQQQTVLAERTLSGYEQYLAGTIAARRTDSGERITSLQNNLADMNVQLHDYQTLLDIARRRLRQGTMSMVEYLTLLRNYVDLQKSDIALRIAYQLEISNRNYWNW
jgi:outer membrane protein TolC